MSVKQNDLALLELDMDTPAAPTAAPAAAPAAAPTAAPKAPVSTFLSSRAGTGSKMMHVVKAVPPCPLSFQPEEQSYLDVIIHVVSCLLFLSLNPHVLPYLFLFFLHCLDLS